MVVYNWRQHDYERRVRAEVMQSAFIKRLFQQTVCLKASFRFILQLPHKKFRHRAVYLHRMAPFQPMVRVVRNHQRLVRDALFFQTVDQVGRLIEPDVPVVVGVDQ